MSKIDNEGGACSSLHVSPTVAATRFATADGVRDLLDTDAGVLPAATGAEGTPALKQTVAVQSQVNEN